MNQAEKPVIRVTEIGEFVHYNSCERRFKLEFNNRKVAKRLPFSERLFNTLDPVLQRSGRIRENKWDASLREKFGYTKIVSSNNSVNDQIEWGDLSSQLSSLQSYENVYAREVELYGEIEGFQLQGRIDFIIVLWDGDKPKLRLVECKASRRDRTYHRVQVAIYRLLVIDQIKKSDLFINGHKITEEDIECVVARIDESTNENQSILELDPIGLDIISADVELLLSPNGTISRIINTELSELAYKLEPKCDGCVFNVHCFPESARLRRLELLGLDPTDIKIFQNFGINTIDDLAELDLTSQSASSIKAAPGFSGDLEILNIKANARRSTLPGGADSNGNSFQVEALPNRWTSQLPEHSINGNALVRIYLSVDYDYTENRIGALSAHITDSSGKLITKFENNGNHWAPKSGIYERVEDGEGFVEKDSSGTDVIRFKTSPWTGRTSEDTGSERELIQSFLYDLIDSLASISNSDLAFIHFYVWSRSEMNQLVEGCTRCGSDLLNHLKQLLGSRQGLEQLIFSCVGEEVNNRYALGWTSTGLSVVSSLRWYGQTYHWRRVVNGVDVDLDKAFTQDIFDFKTDLYLDEDNNWLRNQTGSDKHKFEIRSRFFDSLPAPYWHANWNTLPDPETQNLSAKVQNSIKRYNESSKPGYFREYLKARVHALRWVEEKIRFKNSDIEKVPINISRIREFNLGINRVSRSALDFLQLEQHIKVSTWIAQRLNSPVNRVIGGLSIPLKDITASSDNNLVATINLDAYNIELEELATRSSIQEGSFTRLTPCYEDQNRPQSIGQFFRAGSTCVVDRIDWDSGIVYLSLIPMRTQYSNEYRLASRSFQEHEVLEFGTLDENPTDFVAHRVARQLNSVQSNVYDWFDPTGSKIEPVDSLTDEKRLELSELVSSITFDTQYSLSPNQVKSVVDGLDTRVQLLQGPPGTGKTQTTAMSILTRGIVNHKVGDIILVVGNTHNSVDNLLERINQLKPNVYQSAIDAGLNPPNFEIIKVHSSQIENALPSPIINKTATSSLTEIRNRSRDSIVIIGGTTSALLKMGDHFINKTTFTNFSSDLLVVDEASMMVFPHFLALSSLVADNGSIMLAGDHRQLSPILAHNWEKEDRPPVVLYQPFVSSYDAIQGLIDNDQISDNALRRSALEYTFRLPPLVRSLIAKLYQRDQIELQGPMQGSLFNVQTQLNLWSDLWGGSGVFLVTHDERESKKSNPTEAELIFRIIEAGQDIPDNSIGVITPHRAQRTILKAKLEEFRDKVPVIDTVERLQGGEMPTIIISATASNPTAIADSARFILDLNRSNVAFSRVQKRIIVVCSESLLNHIAPDLDTYESAILWKSLKSLCTELVLETTLDSINVRVYTPSDSVISTTS